MHGGDTTEEDPARLAGEIRRLAEAFASLDERITQIEKRLGEQLKDHVQFIERKTLRHGELSSRIAQRVARLESSVEILARSEAGDEADHA